jgi:hypothetical protein
MRWLRWLFGLWLRLAFDEILRIVLRLALGATVTRENRSPVPPVPGADPPLTYFAADTQKPG